mmetsp:Transcript_16500/g.29932  ORF Transcript_16500/g.29932 Transcript_16500/m.29932 type:complete len:84 (-) Transcript_16500:298-549(-)
MTSSVPLPRKVVHGRGLKGDVVHVNGFISDLLDRDVQPPRDVKAAIEKNKGDTAVSTLMVKSRYHLMFTTVVILWYPSIDKMA